jgi:D-inositol-3-phosphate glycosyltransferase
MQAIVSLRQQVPALTEKLCVAIIGGTADPLGQEDAEVKRLLEMRDALGLGDLVAFLGGRGQHTLPYYYAAAEAVIMPSHYESFGMVALEAMACGTPVVASEVGGLAYLIQDGTTGFHVPDRDPAELAGRIRLLLENAELRQEMSRAAVAYAQQYAWRRIAGQVRDVYDELLLQ